MYDSYIASYAHYEETQVAMDTLTSVFISQLL